MTTMFNNIDTTADVNPANLLPFVGITGRFSQVTGAIFSSIFPPQTPMKYSYFPDREGQQLTLISKYSSRAHTPEKMLSETTDTTEGNAPHADLLRNPIAELDTLSATELKALYPKEYNCWRNMKQRCKDKGVPAHSEFQQFQSFIRIVGPMPAHGATLDRIHNDDPEYAPGKVAWADKRTQSNNKGDTLIFRDPATGETYTASRLAKLQGVTTSAIRHRHGAGWSDAGIIRGSRASSPVLAPVAQIEVQPRNVIAFPRPENALEREFRAKAAAYREHGADAFPASFEVVFDLFEDEANVPDTASPEYARAMEGFEEQYKGYVKAFPAKWARERPHIENFNLYSKLPPHVMQLIAKIDPEFVSKQAERNAQTDLIAQEI